MRFSIIIPVYNVADYLRGCIDSVLANDCSDAEIILVDDGATDGICPGICDEYGANYPDLIRVIHQQNKGLGGARNTGMAAAGGEYLFFVDSDDTLTPNALEILRSAVERNHADVYSFPYTAHDEQGNESHLATSAVFDGVFTLTDHPEFLLSLPVAGARLWKKSLFDRSGIRFPEKAWYEDIRTSMKLFAIADSIVTLETPIYRYLQRQGSIMHSANLARNREILDAFDDLIGWFSRNGLLERYRPELTRLAVDHILLAATVRVARVDPKHPLLSEFQDYMAKHFTDYRKNPYLSQLPALHKLLVVLISNRAYGIVKLLFRLKDGK